MSFDWSANVSVVFGIEIAIPKRTCRLAKRLAEWKPRDSSMFALAAKAVDDSDDLPETVRKRAKLASKVACDYTEPSEHDADGDWSDGPEDLDEEAIAFLAKLKKCMTDSFESDQPSHHPDCSFDLEYNFPELISEAFELALVRLLGPSHSNGLVLQFFTGGAHGDVGRVATEKTLMLHCQTLETMPPDGLDVGRGGIGGIPWGCCVSKIPTGLDLSQEEEQIVAAMNAFGLKAVKRGGQPATIGWHMLSIADGGYNGRCVGGCGV